MSENRENIERFKYIRTNYLQYFKNITRLERNKKETL